ncbi:MAG: hypothetical protein KGN79_12105 [Acidobacteriota bacterium]|nr:hypothetical protein [Acidobacteriota bacterium]
MQLNSKHLVRAVSAAALVSLCALPQCLSAQSTDHVVSSNDLQKATVDASQARAQNLAALNNLLTSQKAQKALEAANMDPAQVKTAVSSLNDQELAQLAAKATKAQNDFAAGYISDRDLLIILVAIAALVLIIVAVH